MTRRKKYLQGRVYYTSDSVLTKAKKKKRRVVVINDNPNQMFVRRILTAGKGRNSLKGILIERYPDIPKISVVENRTFRANKHGKPLVESKMRRSKTRLNKWDRRKIGIK